MPSSSAPAVVCDGSGQSVLRSVPVIPPGPGEIRLRLRLCGLCGTDLFKLATGATHEGLVLGHELVGEVVETGAGVKDFRPGDRVVVPHHVACESCSLCRGGSPTLCEVFRENLLAPGGFSESITVGRRAVEIAARHCPEGLADEAAAFLEPAACVLRGIRKVREPVEGVIVIQGGGSMGLLHLLVLRALGVPARILVVDPEPRRRDLARQLGAEGTAEPGEDAREVLHELGGELGAEIVFDTVGGRRLLAAALELLRPGGSVVLFAHAPDGDHADFELNPVFKNEVSVVSTYSGSRLEQEEIFDLLATGRLDPRPLVTHRLPLSRFEEGVKLSRDLTALKVVYHPDTPAPTGSEESPS